jgi:serine/threonine-protein kinase
MALSVGSLLADRYEITEPIATGGMGEVWQARDRVLGRVVAAKVLKAEYTGDPSFVARFRNEARHTAALTHQNIASVYDYGETTDDTGTQNLAFLVMEFVEGQPLVTILHDEGALPVDWTLHVLSQSADGLSAAHKAGVVHRDIKPGNLIVRPDGVVKLTDFGIAQARDAAPLTRTGMVVGTAQYLSPEQAQGLEVTAASDVYSLGVVAFECLAGVRPFDGASQVAIALAHINRPPPPLPAHVPPAVRLLVERALAKDPADRFPDGGAFAEAIRRVASGGTLAPAPVAGPVTTPTGAVAAASAAAALANSRTQVIAVTDPTAVAAAAGPATGPAGPMPPLQAPPGNDDEWLEPEEPDRRRRRFAWLAAALVLLLLLGGGAVWLLASGDREPGGSTATNPTVTTTAGGVVVDPAAYIGEPADDVEAELTELGLSVTRETADESQLAEAGIALEAGDVADLAPTGSVPADSTITLYVAEEAYAPDDDEPEDEEPTETTAPTTTTPPPTSSSSSSSSSTSTSTTTTSTSTSTSTETLPGEPVDTDGDGTPDETDPEPENPDVPAPPGAADQGEAG